MSLKSHGYSFSLLVPDMITTDNKTGMDRKLESEVLVSSTAQNDPESVKQAFLYLMELYTRTPHFEQIFRKLPSDILLNTLIVKHFVNTSS